MSITIPLNRGGSSGSVCDSSSSTNRDMCVPFVAADRPTVIDNVAIVDIGHPLAHIVNG